MSNSRNLTPGQRSNPKFSAAITTAAYQKLINNTLGDPERAKRFVSSITSAVAVNPALQECEAGTILAGALLGESLNLSPSPQLGQYYLVPFVQKVKDENGKTKWILDEKGNHITDERGNWLSETITKAVFVLGYKGYLQLAMRSGQLKKINAVEIKEGELKHFDPLNEEITAILIDDWEKRESAPTSGYYAFFELTNGFRKAIYWSKEQMMSHADKYSSAFSKAAMIAIENGKVPQNEMWKYSSFWYKNFDEMAKKTMLRQLISKGGCPMSTEMMSGYESDNTVKGIANGNIVDVETDNAPQLISPEQLAPEAENVVEQASLDDFDVPD